MFYHITRVLSYKYTKIYQPCPCVSGHTLFCWQMQTLQPTTKFLEMALFKVNNILDLRGIMFDCSCIFFLICTFDISIPPSHTTSSIVFKYHRTFQPGIIDRGRSKVGLWGASDSFCCLFQVTSFLIQLFAIGNIAIWLPRWQYFL